VFFYVFLGGIEIMLANVDPFSPWIYWTASQKTPALSVKGRLSEPFNPILELKIAACGVAVSKHGSRVKLQSLETARILAQHHGAMELHSG
jgi:hypothetical protein